MSPIVESGASSSASHIATELRVFRTMIVLVTVAVACGLAVAAWRTASGLAVGGALSILNYHWLRTSMASVFQNQSYTRPRISILKYILRYLVITAILGGTYKLQIISLPAAIVGLCSFVPAFFIEASRQSYFAIIGREESF